MNQLLLTAGRPVKGLLCEPRDLRLRRLVHELWLHLQEVRRSKSPESLYRAMQAMKELQSTGVAVVILQKGKIVGVNDPRFSADIQIEEPVPQLDPELQRREKLLRLKKLFDRLPPHEQRELLKEMRLKWIQNNQQTKETTRP